ncbi:MAG: S8 family serine peptidase, partial [Thermoplasmata archaeon]|nr:S8 family serine peptidase [Thermoplasmata archaeon]
MVAALVLALLAALPVVPGAFAASLPQFAQAPAPVATSPTEGALPGALDAPWAARTGFAAAFLNEVLDPQLAVGPVTVVVSFWPSSPSFFLPPGPGGALADESRLADRYGLAPPTFTEIERYFAGRGLLIEHAPADRLSLTVLGPGTLVGAAFGTTILSGVWQGRAVHFPTSPTVLPSWLAPVVAAISGLSDGFTTFAFDLQPAALSSPAQGRTSSYITPSAAHLLYGLSDLYNASGTAHYAQGVGIAIVLWGDGYDPNDLSTFFSQYYASGFPSVLLYYDPIDGAPDPAPSAVSDPSNSPQELTLDLEWAGSAAPGASLYAVYAPDGPSSNGYSPSDSNLEDALNAAIDTTGVQVVSMSFGTPDGGDPALQDQFALSFARATQKGITILAASGDNGGTSAANCSGVATPEFPASSPSVLAVGGTAPVESLDPLGAVTGLDSEPAWNGSGGG